MNVKNLSETIPKFGDLLLSQTFTHLGFIFDRLILKSPNISAEILSSKIEHLDSKSKSDPDNLHSNKEIRTNEQTLQIDFSPFFKSTKCPEMFSIVQMLDQGLDDLVRTVQERERSRKLREVD